MTSTGAPRIDLNPVHYNNAKVIDAESFLKESGYAKVFSVLKQNHKYKRVVIMGGNKIGFAVALLLLKGPNHFECREEVLNLNGTFLSKRMKQFKKEQEAEKPLIKDDFVSEAGKSEKTIASKTSTITANSQATVISKSTTISKQSSPTKSPAKSTIKDMSSATLKTVSSQKNSPAKRMSDTFLTEFLNCNTYGSIKGKEYTVISKMKYNIPFEEEEIIIIYDPQELKLHFKNAQEAKEYTYPYYESEMTKDGEINPINGLSGDARRLYYDVNQVLCNFS